MTYKAHIPPETASMLATQNEEKVDKQNEIDMPNIKQTQRLAIPAIYSVGTCVGVLLGYLSAIPTNVRR